jgi:glutathione-independent formaldehyde dehydrogenase
VLQVTEDPGATDKAAQHGSLSIRIGEGWSKSHSFFTGQTPVLRYNTQLMRAIIHDKVRIAAAVNARVISLDEAPKAYAEFDKGASAKFIIDPHNQIKKR